MNRDPKFDAFLKALLEPEGIDSGATADRMINASFLALELRLLAQQVLRGTAAMQVNLRGNRPTMIVIDDMYTEPLRPIRIQSPFTDFGWIDELLAMEAQLPPLAQDEPEPRAKNGALASKKTERAKAKLAFYQGKRRF